MPTEPDGNQEPTRIQPDETLAQAGAGEHTPAPSRAVPFADLDKQFAFSPEENANDDPNRTLPESDMNRTAADLDPDPDRTILDSESVHDPDRTVADSDMARTIVSPEPGGGAQPDPDRTLLDSESERTVTVKQRAPRSSPHTNLTHSWALAVVWFVLPTALGIFLLASAASGDRNLHFRWLTAAATSEGSVVARPRADGQDKEIMAFERQGDRLIARHGAREAWSFPANEALVLPGESLDDAVFWIPVRIASTLELPENRVPALLVFWRERRDRVGRTHLSLLDREGAEVWTTPLEGRAAPERLSWSESQDQLLFVRDSAPPVCYSLPTGERFPASSHTR